MLPEPHRLHRRSALEQNLQDVMWEKVGPFRTADQLQQALDGIRKIHNTASAVRPPEAFNLDLQDRLELRAMLITAEAVVRAAIGRTESRGAHPRLDYPDSNSGLARSQVIEMEDDALLVRWHNQGRL